MNLLSGCLGLLGRMAMFLLGPVVGGLVVGWYADSMGWSARILSLEPLLLVLGAWAAYGLLVRKRWIEGIFLATGVSLAAVAIRLPFPPPNDAHLSSDLPAWLPKVEECMGAVIWPSDGVRLLQWTLPMSGVDVDEVLRVADSFRPDLLVLSSSHDPGLASKLQDQLGGEYQLQEPAESFGGRIVLARGLFHQCGESTEWVHGASHFSFAGVTNATRVPLLVTSHPGPLSGGDWSQVQQGWGQDLELVGRIQSPALIVVASAPALPTWRYLEESMVRASLFTAPSPPSWPVRMGPLPMLPLQTHERLWAGPGWRVAAAERIPSSLGNTAAILTSLEPAN